MYGTGVRARVAFAVAGSATIASNPASTTTARYRTPLRRITPPWNHRPQEKGDITPAHIGQSNGARARHGRPDLCHFPGRRCGAGGVSWGFASESVGICALAGL